MDWTVLECRRCGHASFLVKFAAEFDVLITELATIDTRYTAAGAYFASVLPHPQARP